MKVRITEETKRAIKAYQIPIAREIVKACAGDEATVKEYATIAARVLLPDVVEAVFTAEAEVMPNCRSWERIINGSENLDVWINFTAKSRNDFVEGGAYLSDIWELTGDNGDEIAEHMYKRLYHHG